MRSRYQPLAIPTINASSFVVKAPYPFSGIDILEIGCGKGQFIVEHARRYPGLRHVAIEQSSDVLYRAVQKTKETSLDNLWFVWGNADDLLQTLPRVNTLYLQFSDPWPKARHEKRRLTTISRLNGYYDIGTSTIVFKTDNEAFYQYSLSQFEASRFTIMYQGIISPSDEITTEFEDKYRKLKKLIYKIEAKR